MDAALAAAAIGVGGTVIVGIAGFWASVRNTNKTTALTLRAIGALLNGALLGENLARADLTGAFRHPGEPVPFGWQRDTETGRLRRAGAHPGGD